MVHLILRQRPIPLLRMVRQKEGSDGSNGTGDGSYQKQGVVTVLSIALDIVAYHDVVVVLHAISVK